MDWKEIASRIKGISTPLGGIDYEAPEREVAVVRRILAYLEDRRVLYALNAVERAEECIASANDIRHYITTELGNLHSSGQLRAVLQRIRQAARDFVSVVEEKVGPNGKGVMRNTEAAAEFGLALGQLRSTVGTYVAILASTYRLNVDDDLAAMLPPKLRDRDV